jgi:hypothetical protein
VTPVRKVRVFSPVQSRGSRSVLEIVAKAVSRMNEMFDAKLDAMISW